MLQSLVQPVKGIFPSGKAYRKLLFGPAAGCVMEVEPRKRLRTYLGIYEWELNGYLRRLVTPGSKCFDLGGNEGYDCLMLANLSRSAVVTIECDPAMALTLRRNIAQNPNLRIQIVESMVAGQSGDGKITIDDAARKFFVPDFIKMDIEGFEDAALEGASQVLADRHPAMIIEVHGRDKEEHCMEILRRHSYRTAIVNPSWFFKDSFRWGHNRWIVAFSNS